MKGFFDTSNPWHVALAASGAIVRAGILGIIRYNVGMTNPWTIPVSVSQLVHRSAVANGIEEEFMVKLNSLAGAYSAPS